MVGKLEMNLGRRSASPLRTFGQRGGVTQREGNSRYKECSGGSSPDNVRRVD